MQAEQYFGYVVENCTERTGLEFTGFPGEVKIVAERQKLEGGFHQKGTFLTSTNAKSRRLLVRKVEIYGGNVNFFCNNSDGKVIFFRNFEPCREYPTNTQKGWFIIKFEKITSNFYCTTISITSAMVVWGLKFIQIIKIYIMYTYIYRIKKLHISVDL